MKTLIINDLHLGVQRSGGTTLASATELREFAHTKHRELLELAPLHGCGRIIVNGDLTDVYDIPLGQALQIYCDTDAFMDSYPHTEVIWAVGNHDLSKDSSRLGTVAFIGALLALKHPDYFKLVDKPTLLDDGATYVLPHVPNQDIFEMELDRVPEGVKHLLLHCNYDNTFAMAADHSLNLSRQQAKALKERGITMILGHEHHQKESLGGSVLVVGNQFPTSVSDCIESAGKRALIVDGGACHFIPTWTPDDADGWYAEVDWTDLKEIEEEGRGFVRVNGSASAAEASDVVKAISAFRQRSQSFVVTNAVAIEQTEGLGELASSIEDIRNVNVMSLLLEMLEPAQREAIEKLTKENA